MTYLDNPAGRLHSILSDLAQQSIDRSLIKCWAISLEVEPQRVPLELAAIASLLVDIEFKTRESGSSSSEKSAALFMSEWSRPIIPSGPSLTDKAVNLLPSDEAMAALESVSEILHHNMPEGEIPSADELDELAAQLTRIKREVIGSDEIPVDLKQVVVDRLSDIILAIERIRISGPQAVTESIESLLGAILVRDVPRTRKFPWRTVWQVLIGAMQLFAVVPDLAGLIDPASGIPELPEGEGDAAVIDADAVIETEAEADELSDPSP